MSLSDFDAAPASASSWGDWRLDDLVQALQRTTRLISPSAQVAWVSLYTPGTPTDVPTVHVTLTDRAAVEKAHDSIIDGPQLAHFQRDYRDNGFIAEVDDLYLHVRCFSEGRA